MRAVALALAAASALPSAAPSAAGTLAQLTAGRVAAAPRECILPEARVRPVIVDGQAIVFRSPRTVYVVRPDGACPGLTADAALLTSSINGELCRHDQFRIVSPAGSGPAATCTFGTFVPYRRAG